MRINVFVETDDPDLIPKRQTEGSSGYDLHSNIDTTLQPDECKVIPTGIKLSIPPGYEGQVRSRSGLAAKHMIQVLNSPGTIDSDYRGEIGVILMNHSLQPFTINKYDRIAQLVFAPAVDTGFWEDQVGTSQRGDGGFGSSGL